MREHVAVPLLGPIELRELLGDVSLEEHILSLLSAFPGAAQIFSRFDVVATLARNDADMPEDFPAPRRRDLARQREQHFHALLGLVIAACRDAKLNLIESDVHLVGMIVLLAECL